MLGLFPFSLAFADLNGISNIDRFSIPEDAMAILDKNLFVVCPASHWQPFFVYEDNAYQRIPNFVTVDSVLHLYHIFFNFALRRLEEERLIPLTELFTKRFISQALKTYNLLGPGILKDASLRNLAYLGVASNLLKLKVNLPPEVQAMVQRELDLIRGRKGLVVGAIFPYAIDYTQFAPRGHYTRTERLRNYFMAMTWYGLVPFSPAYRDREGKLKVSYTVALQAILMVRDVRSAKLFQDWDTLLTSLNYFIGFADDLDLREVESLMEEVFGKEATLSDFVKSERLKSFTERFVKLRAPKVKPKVAWLVGRLPNLPDPESSQLRLLGQRYTPDSEVLEELTDPEKRPIPCALDLAVVMGSDRAKDIVDAGYRVYGLPESFSLLEWEGYRAKRDELCKRFSRLGEREWTSNLYWSWLWVLKSLFDFPDERAPAFMKTMAWKDKSLQTALASWAQLRHDTILYVKQSLAVAEGGDGDEEVVKGYVEPNPEAWRRLLKLVVQTRELLGSRGLLVESVKDKLESFDDMVRFLLKCAEKELEGEPLSEEDYRRIQFIGGDMDYMALSIVSDGKALSWAEVIHPSDRNMACIADVHTADIRFGGLGHVALEEAVGHAHEIFVVVPIEGKLYLTRGAVMSYYEFLQPAKDRLTDERWQKMLAEGKAPPQPPWVSSFTSARSIEVRKLPIR